VPWTTGATEGGTAIFIYLGGGLMEKIEEKNKFNTSIMKTAA
jgi:hypothetical protein